MSLRKFAVFNAVFSGWVALFLGLCVSFAATAQQQSADSFTVREIPVDVTATDVLAARDKAMMEGQRKAYDMLMRRLVAEGQAGKAPVVTNQELMNLVAEVIVDEENMSSVRYVGMLTVRFRADQIRNLLQNSGVAYAEWRGGRVLVVPVWPSIFEGEDVPADNPWRDAWLSSATQGLAPFQIMAAQEADEVGHLLDGASVLALESYAAGKGAKDLILSRVRINQQDGEIVVTVKTDALGAYAARLQGERIYKGSIEAGQDVLLQKAAGELAQIINQDAKSAMAIYQGKPSVIKVIVPLHGNLSGWVRLREKLSRAASVRGYELNALTKKRAALTLHYVGPQEQLESNLVQNGLVLTWAEDHWELASTGY